MLLRISSSYRCSTTNLIYVITWAGCGHNYIGETGDVFRNRVTVMVGEMVQNSQSSYLFTFTAVIVIHEYIYSHSTTKFTSKKYICLHLTTYFLFTNIFTHIYGMYSFTFNGLYPFTFTIQIFIQHGAIFIQDFLRTPFAHHQVPAPSELERALPFSFGQRMTFEQVTFLHLARWRLSRMVVRMMNWRVLSGVVFVKK